MQTLPVRRGGRPAPSGRPATGTVRRAPRWWALLAAAVLLLLDNGASVQQAAAYEFLTKARIRSLVVLDGADALRWDPAVWGSGEMAVVVPDDPDWLHLFADMEEVREMVAGILRGWREIDTADIRWSLAEDSDALSAKVVIHTGEETFARVTSRDSGGAAPLITRCDVQMNLGPDGHDDSTPLIISHELGHCLGLDHPMGYPDRWTHNGKLLGLWGPNGPMAGYYNTPVPSPDDRIGISLLRPASSWTGTTGSIYGTVLGGGGGSPVARHVNVLATRRRPDGSMGDGVMRFTGYYGEFAIDGLSPGAWFLMVYSLRSWRGNSPGAQKWLKVKSPTVDVIPILHLDPIEVRAGERTGPVVLSVRPAER